MTGFIQPKKISMKGLSILSEDKTHWGNVSDGQKDWSTEDTDNGRELKEIYLPSWQCLYGVAIGYVAIGPSARVGVLFLSYGVAIGYVVIGLSARNVYFLGRRSLTS